jgi:hypothetical protein
MIASVAPPMMQPLTARPTAEELGAVQNENKSNDFKSAVYLLAPAAQAMFYERGTGLLRSALELPLVDEDRSRS